LTRKSRPKYTETKKVGRCSVDGYYGLPQVIEYQLLCHRMNKKKRFLNQKTNLSVINTVFNPKLSEYLLDDSLRISIVLCKKMDSISPWQSKKFLHQPQT
jgi:hypothetical protein